MYITITPQKLGDRYSQSVADFVAYLEKENDGKSLEDIEPFFDQHGEQVEVKDVIHGIDANTAKLKKTEPKFYSVTLNPSQRELAHIGNSTDALKDYTRKVMEVYASAFNREIQGKPVTVDDLRFYAKIEHQRTYKGTDKVIRENAPFYKKIVALKNEIQKIESGKLVGNIAEKQQRVKQLEGEAPHKIKGKMIVQGMAKEGSQSIGRLPQLGTDSEIHESCCQGFAVIHPSIGGTLYPILL